MSTMKYIAIFVIAIAFVFLPSNLSGGFIGVRTQARLSVRLMGVFGLIWLVLAIALDRRLQTVELLPTTRQLLMAARHYLGGIIIGLFIAIYTRKVDEASTGPTGRGRKEEKRNFPKNLDH